MRHGSASAEAGSTAAKSAHSDELRRRKATAADVRKAHS
jgi:hypothetical protein